MTRRKDGRGKKTKDRNAPRPPNTSYTIYFKQAFREYAEAHPGEDRKRITAVVAEKWRGMTADEKKPFEESAANEREQYEKDLAEYKKTDAYKEFVGKVKEADRVSRKEKHHQARLKIGDIPIFSKEFIDYNKARETELRKVRREISTYEEEVESLAESIAILEKRITSLRDEMEANHETEATMSKTAEAWQKIVLKSLKEANLLATLGLGTSASTEELVEMLEKHSGNADLRRCIGACRFA